MTSRQIGAVRLAEAQDAQCTSVWGDLSGALKVCRASYWELVSAKGQTPKKRKNKHMTWTGSSTAGARCLRQMCFCCSCGQWLLHVSTQLTMHIWIHPRVLLQMSKNSYKWTQWPDCAKPYSSDQCLVPVPSLVMINGGPEVATQQMLCTLTLKVCVSNCLLLSVTACLNQS